MFIVAVFVFLSKQRVLFSFATTYSWLIPYLTLEQLL